MCVYLERDVFYGGCDSLSTDDGFVLGEDGELGQGNDVIVAGLRSGEVFAAFGMLIRCVSGNGSLRMFCRKWYF